jgi:peptide/nickel transport system substrate-binding protein
LLDGAGWTRGADGIRAKNGVKLNLNVAVRAGATEVDDQFELIRNDWKPLGVALNVQHYPAATFFAPAKQGGTVYGDAWDVITFAYAADPIGDFAGTYGCDAMPPVGANNVHWCNRTAQASMEALERHYELSQRIADLKVTMHEFINDAPSIVSFIREDLFGYNKDLKNYHPNNLTPFDNMMNVDI